LILILNNRIPHLLRKLKKLIAWIQNLKPIDVKKVKEADSEIKETRRSKRI